jgi:hypothetical protein
LSLVLAVRDTATFPGVPVAKWAPAVAGEPFSPPHGRGMPTLINGSRTARCRVCSRSVKWCADGRLVTHKIGEERCPGSNTHPALDPVIAAWLPVKAGLTAHGLRHSQKTWMVEDGIPEILSELRLGHEVPGMRGLYSHVSVPMRDALKEALQRRWEQSLRDRAALDPVSAVPALNRPLVPFMTPDVKPKRNRRPLRAA